MKRKVITISSIVVLFISVLMIGGFQFFRMDLKNNTTVIELGEQLNAEVSNYAKGNISSAKLDLSDVNTTKAGIYNAYISNKTQKLTFNVEVVDTIPPTADKIEGLSFLTNEVVKAESLIVNMKDYSKITVSFADGNVNHTYTQGGIINEVIILNDESGNETKINVSFEVIEDEKKPVLSGIKNITAFIDEKINYFDGITAIDDRDGDISKNIKVNTDGINLNKPGQYSVLYSIKDSSGNETTKKIKVTLLKDKSPVFKGISNKTSYLNEKIDFLNGVTAIDDRDGDITSKIKVDTTNVNINVAGIYKVTYSVVDSAKNKTTKSITITIKKKETVTKPKNAKSTSPSTNNSTKKDKSTKSKTNGNSSSEFNFFDVNPEQGSDVNGDVPASGEHVGNWG
ncbi:DUF5011 domain-containing protein [Anaerocolumna sp. AGMB13020]|uniref:immunoglobulin-like domain-containing protein n=1 Tax=Anaerocolumna sp. AGMB13020 TaxID=3081750 RepID=UPI0029529A55|nr:immunoglobulin-like domain-containing protein [Anaerocolumna sp. AGMB13020]WOO35779.1 DUF5011 domain-containing protein [Anaerocolumna sp. AGMB13020]